MPVRKGDYWRADFSCGAVTGMHVYWIPIGSGGSGGSPVTYTKNQAFSGPSSTTGSLYCNGSDTRLSGSANGCGSDPDESWCGNGPTGVNGWSACCYDPDGGGVNFAIDLLCEK